MDDIYNDLSSDDDDEEAEIEQIKPASNVVEEKETSDEKPKEEVNVVESKEEESEEIKIAKKEALRALYGEDSDEEAENV